MRVTSVNFRRKVSFGNYCNEEYGVVIEVDDGDDVDAVMSSARVMVSAALDASQREREFIERVARVKLELERQQSEGVAVSREMDRASSDEDEEHWNWLAERKAVIEGKVEVLQAQLDELLRNGPDGAGEGH